MTRYILPVFLMLLVSCSKTIDSGYKTGNIVYLKNSKLFNSKPCFSPSNIHAGSGFLISDVYSYAKYADSMRIYPYNSDCDTATLCRVDFSKYSLIGIKTEYGACDSVYRRIEMDDRSRKLRYRIDIIESDDPCYVLSVDLNLVLVPKLPDNYGVAFEVNRHN